MPKSVVFQELREKNLLLSLIELLKLDAHVITVTSASRGSLVEHPSLVGIFDRVQ